MPALFIAHGNPMNAVERSRYTEGWSDELLLSAGATIGTVTVRVGFPGRATPDP